MKSIVGQRCAAGYYCLGGNTQQSPLVELKTTTTTTTTADTTTPVGSTTATTTSISGGVTTTNTTTTTYNGVSKIVTKTNKIIIGDICPIGKQCSYNLVH